MNKRLDSCIDQWVHALILGWMDGWMDVCMHDLKFDGCMYTKIDGLICMHPIMGG